MNNSKLYVYFVYSVIIILIVSAFFSTISMFNAGSYTSSILPYVGGFILIIVIIGLFKSVRFMNNFNPSKVISSSNIKKIVKIEKIEKPFFSIAATRRPNDFSDSEYLNREHIDIFVIYSVNNKSTLNNKISVFLVKEEFERLKQNMEVGIVINQNNYNDIAMDWEWLGREPF